MIRNRFFIVGVVLAGLFIASAVGYSLVRSYILSQVGSASETQYLYIKSGSGLAQVAEAVEESGLAVSAWHVSLGARFLGLERSLKAGEYEIGHGLTVEELLLRLQEGKTYLRRVSIPEGYSILEIEQLLLGCFGLNTAGMYLPAEGSILPETYFYSRGESANALIARMVQAMTETLSEGWKKRAERLPLESDYQAVVLASIVEKETGVADERAQVAAVFLNRLKRNMRLQSDPTVIYGVTGGLPLRRSITRADLQQETAYNTYRINGLPPTPIANPGKASIEAVLNPADVPYLYFVANGSGGHTFATTLADHNRNVRAWRKVRAQASQKE